uniref:Uncharacterized protein n=1 Tax=uncultured marine virus TaxID=186617 RepID=A0A0F7L517_9VIRU|nr:hypothetical protein [uncultured marine virus]
MLVWAERGEWFVFFRWQHTFYLLTEALREVWHRWGEILFVTAPEKGFWFRVPDPEVLFYPRDVFRIWDNVFLKKR